MPLEMEPKKAAMIAVPAVAGIAIGGTFFWLTRKQVITVKASPSVVYLCGAEGKCQTTVTVNIKDGLGRPVGMKEFTLTFYIGGTKIGEEKFMTDPTGKWSDTFSWFVATESTTVPLKSEHQDTEARYPVTVIASTERAMGSTTFTLVAWACLQYPCVRIDPSTGRITEGVPCDQTVPA